MRPETSGCGVVLRQFTGCPHAASPERRPRLQPPQTYLLGLCPPPRRERRASILGGCQPGSSDLLPEPLGLVGEGRRGTTASLIPEGIRFHDLRHSHATALIAGGNSVKAVFRRLGHSDIAVTLKVYGHLLPDDDEKLAGSADALFG
ncbi:MAG: tyrosine-type recombinase/integrase [Gemmataceae bacterium]|nr:tyrosine-type recombinase/integrase [Gemmataceae bacterium]